MQRRAAHSEAHPRSSATTTSGHGISSGEKSFRSLADAYGAGVDERLLLAIERAQQRMHALIERATDAGRDDALSQIQLEQRWLRANGQHLIDQSR